MYMCPIGTFAYTVKSGDTLYDIAKRHNTSVDMLIAYNPFIDPERLSIGQMICIPLGGSGFDVSGSATCNFVTVKPGDTLNEYSRLYNIPVEAIIEANPGIIPNNLRIGQVVCIPVSTMERDYTRQNITNLPRCVNVKVRDGDYPYIIAQRYKTTVEEILRVNPTINPTNLKVGQEICIPVTAENYNLLLKETEPASYTCINHRVRKGDTFKDLAKEYGVSLNSILAANPGVDPSELSIGQIICIPKPVIETNSSIEYQDMDEERETSLVSPFCMNYTIKQGDTFRDLARKFNTTVEAIMIANPMADPYNLQIGQVICIPQIQAVNCVYRTIRQGDTFAELSRIYNVDVEAIVNANPHLNPDNLQIGQVVCIPIITTRETHHDKKCLKYKIEQGDTLVKLSRKYNTTVEALLLANPGVDPENLKIGSTVCIPISPEMMKKSLIDLNKRLRVLWANHSMLDNLLIMSIIYDLPTLPAFERRLLRNPNDFKEVLIPFYGEANAARFANFLTTHINLGEDLIMNLKRNDMERVNMIERDLLANADETSRFLASINSMWSQREWNRYLTNHVRLSRKLAEHYLARNFDEAVRTMEDDYMNSLEMGDLMSEGIIRQFPKQF